MDFHLLDRFSTCMFLSHLWVWAHLLLSLLLPYMYLSPDLLKWFQWHLDLYLSKPEVQIQLEMFQRRTLCQRNSKVSCYVALTLDRY